ncbi:MAG: ribokinase [Oscillospiraceae bacterium]|nr:ribokinase [Oscillospiraceae bacterium]
MRILVVGSINHDIVFSVARAPLDGETVWAGDVRYCPGGKGGNQAAVCARLDVHTGMVGCVGDDEHGEAMLKSLRKMGVDTQFIQKTPQKSTGSAYITVDFAGQNRIVVYAGANDCVTREMVAEALQQPWDVVIVQWELPLDVVMDTVTMAAALGIAVVMDPAPALPLAQVCIPKGVTVFTPNEHEAQILTGHSIHEHPELVMAALNDIAPILLIKMGDKGAILRHDGVTTHHAAELVDVVDTTGAGDVFTAAFTVKYWQGKCLDEAVKFANALAATHISQVCV